MANQICHQNTSAMTNSNRVDWNNFLTGKNGTNYLAPGNGKNQIPIYGIYGYSGVGNNYLFWKLSHSVSEKQSVNLNDNQ